MPTVFAERRLTLEPAGEVLVTIFSPEQRERRFRCDWTIAWPDRSKRFWSDGEDGVQALLCAMTMIRATLVVSEEYERGALTWLGMRDLGLPSSEMLEPR